MSDGGLNVGRIEGKVALKPTVGKNAASRRKMRRNVSKARRRIVRQAVRTEWWSAQEENG